MGETDVAVRAGVDEVEWRKRVVRPEDFGFQEVDGVKRVLELTVEGCEALGVMADGGGVVDDCDESGVEALDGGCVVVLEGVAGDEGAKGAALDGPFGLEKGGEGVVVGASVDDDCGFAAVGKVYGAPGFLEGCVVVDVGEGLVSGGVLEGGLVVSEENCAVVREFEFDLNSVFGELGAAWGEGVLAEGGEFGVKVGFGGGESVGGGDGSEGVWDANGAGVEEVPFFGREEGFVGVEDLARECGEGIVGDAFGEAGEGFEDGFVFEGL